MSKILTAVRRAFGWVGRQLRRVLPAALLGREKAVVAFLVPIIVTQLARFLPSFDVDPSLLEQLLLAVVSAITVHATTNTEG